MVKWTVFFVHLLLAKIYSEKVSVEILACPLVNFIVDKRSDTRFKKFMRFVFVKNKLASLSHASVLLLKMNFLITL